MQATLVCLHQRPEIITPIRPPSEKTGVRQQQGMFRSAHPSHNNRKRALMWSLVERSKGATRPGSSSRWFAYSEQQQEPETGTSKYTCGLVLGALGESLRIWTESETKRSIERGT
eukprot:scaffold353140_cov18-Prasinocladus_malaysianus.AAC.1